MTYDVNHLSPETYFLTLTSSTCVLGKNRANQNNNKKNNKQTHDKQYLRHLMFLRTFLFPPLCLITTSWSKTCCHL